MDLGLVGSLSERSEKWHSVSCTSHSCKRSVGSLSERSEKWHFKKEQRFVVYDKSDH